MYFNGILISPQTDTYAYKAYIEMLLNYNQEEAQTTLRVQQIMPDAFDTPVPITDNKIDMGNTAHRGLTVSRKATVNAILAGKPPYFDGVRCSLSFKPHSKAFHLSKPLPPQ